MSNLLIAQIALEFWGAFFSALAALMMSFSVARTKRSSSIIQWLLLINMDNLIADAFSIIFSGHKNRFGFFMTRFCNFIEVMTIYVMVLLMAHYVYSLVRENCGKNLKQILYLVGIILLFPVISLITNPFNGRMYYYDEMNLYHRGTLFYGIMGTVLLAMYVCLVVVIIYRKKVGVLSWTATLICILVPVILMGVQAFHKGFSFVNIGITVSLLFMMVAYQKEQTLVFQKQNELLQANYSKMLLGQLKPKFMKETLSQIEEYSVTDSLKAREMIKTLSSHIGNTFDFMAKNELIQFEQEMELVDSYLKLALSQNLLKVNVQKRFEVTDFKLPALSIVPLVENAICHGFVDSAKEYNLVIRTFEKDNQYVVAVFDDGCGFDEKVLSTSAACQALDGIQTVRERISLLASGRLEIESHIGEGTAVAVYIPKENR